MRRFVLPAVAACLALCLPGCGADADPQQGSSTSGDTAVADVPVDAGLLADAADTAEKPVDSGPAAGECAANADCAPLEDGDLCNGTLFCDTGLSPAACRPLPGSIVVCDTVGDTACALTACAPNTGKCASKPRPDGTACVDDDPCTVDSTCKAGTCEAKGDATWCQCDEKADCAGHEDGDKCNGTLYCDKGVFPFRCRVDPGTVVKCATGTDPCVLSVCDPIKGACGTAPAPTGTPCDDKVTTTIADFCEAGVCKGTNIAFCKIHSDCAAHEDGDLCNGTLYCDGVAHVCKVNPITKVTCPDVGDTACKSSQCQPATGKCKLAPRNDGKACEDGDPCTDGDTCKAGVCAAGTDTCSCQTDAECEKKYGDKNLCNGTMFCNKALSPRRCKLNPATRKSCPSADNTTCRVNACVRASGACTPTAIEDAAEHCDMQGDPKCRWEQRPMGQQAQPPACDDGDKCTKGEICAAGACQGGTFTCTCASDSDCKDAGDGDKCKGTYFCDKSGKVATCKLNPATAITCPGLSNTACIANTCLPSSGACQLQAINQGKGCDDGDACTAGDTCKAGACLGTETCACTKDAECAGKEDGNACNGTLFCDKSLKKPRCVVNPKTKLLCPSAADTACLLNACVPMSGACSLTVAEDTVQRCDVEGAGPNGTMGCRVEQRPAGEKGPAPACEDGDPCTAGDRCKAGKCTTGKFVCVCDKDADCATKTDGDLCKGAWFCDKSGKAGKSAQCRPNPKNFKVCPSFSDTACVKNRCRPDNGKCMAGPLMDGAACDDGEPCREGTVCLGGECKAGIQTCECITHAECEAKKGDNNLCNGTLFCDKSGPKPKCALNLASVVKCPQDTGTICAIKTCNPANGICQAAPANEGKTCSDGDVCTGGDRCVVGLCKGATATACDDGDKCTIDRCDKQAGCSHEKRNCDDGNACTDELCAPLTGKCVSDVGKFSGKPCSADGNPCTEGDACDKGVCKAGVPVVCKQPADPCALSKCVGLTASSYKCVTLAAADGKDCDDGKACLAGASCKQGKCAQGTAAKLWVKTISVGDPAAKGAKGVSLVDVVADGDGALALSPNMVIKDAPRIWRLSATGEVLGNREIVAPSAGNDRLYHLARTKNGLVAAGGRYSGDAKSARVLVVRMNADGSKTLGEQLYGVTTQGVLTNGRGVGARPGKGFAVTAVQSGPASPGAHWCGDSTGSAACCGRATSSRVPRATPTPGSSALTAASSSASRRGEPTHTASRATTRPARPWERPCTRRATRSRPMRGSPTWRKSPMAPCWRCTTRWSRARASAHRSCWATRPAAS